MVKAEELMALKRFRCEEIEIDVHTHDVRYYANYDDEEDVCRSDSVDRVKHRLDNLLMYGALRFISTIDGLLIPMHYAVTPDYMHKQYAHYIEREVDSIIAGDIFIHPTLLRGSRIFDGYGHVRLNKENPAEYPVFPLLAKKGCEYITKLHAIRGETKNLMVGLEALW
jgi:hypothetical protein